MSSAVRSTSEILEMALHYAARGLPVFPAHTPTGAGGCSCGKACGRVGKHPRWRRGDLEHGHKSATTDAALVRDWWGQWPDANVGIAVPPGVLVLDVDPEGIETLAALEAEHGALPATVEALTARGRHLWFTVPPPFDLGPRVAVAPGLDTRADGGYVIAPPSLHESGARYRWRTFRADAMRPAPEWLLELAAPPVHVPPTAPRELPPLVPKLDGYERYVTTVVEAQCGELAAMAPNSGRNDRLNRAAFRLGQLVGGGVLEESTARAFLLDAAARCKLLEEEPGGTLKTIDSGLRAGQRTPDRPEPARRPDAPAVRRAPAQDEAPPASPWEVDLDRVEVRRAAPAAQVEARSDGAAPAAPPADAPPAPPAGGDGGGGSEGNWRGRLLYGAPDATGFAKLLKRAHNAALFLEHHPDVRGSVGFNEMTGRVVITRRPDINNAGLWRTGEDLADHHEVAIQRWLEVEAQHTYSTATVHALLDQLARTRSFHPVRCYLEGLSWDGTPRLSTWLEVYLGAPESRYAQHVGRWWLISAVARAMRPGIKADHVLILEGPQGLGKSSALRELAGEQWFCDSSLDIGNKDAQATLSNAWIFELAELSSLSRKQVESIKAFLSNAEDTFRPSYGRNVERRPRHCVFAGTTNDSNYLRDLTGNRRFWPVHCERVEVRALAADRDQLWAEAVAAYRRGERWWPETDDEVALCAAEQGQRVVSHPWEDHIVAYVDAPDRRAIDWFSSEELLTHAVKVPPERQDTVRSRELGQVMRQLGWAPHRKWLAGRGSRYQRGFQRPNTVASDR